MKKIERKFKGYSKEEIDFIKSNYGIITSKQISKILNRFSKNGDNIQVKARSMGLKSSLGKTHFFGKKHTKKTLKLMSDIKKGFHNPFYNKKHTKESKKKIGLKSKELWKNKEHYKKMQNLMLGKNNPRYKDGNGKQPYPMEWNNFFKNKIRERDEYCKICGIGRGFSFLFYNQDLEVHHIDRNKKNLNPFNLICLCLSCHSKIQSFQDDLKDFFLAKNLNLC